MLLSWPYKSGTQVRVSEESIEVANADPEEWVTDLEGICMRL